MTTFYVGIILMAAAFAALVVRASRTLSPRSPDDFLHKMRRLSDSASSALKEMGKDFPIAEPTLLSWTDVASMYLNSRGVILPMARSLAEISPEDPEIAQTRLALLKRHRRLRGFLFIHIVENLVDKISGITAQPTQMRAYARPAIWAYSEEILILENLLEAVSAPRRFTDTLEEIL